MAGNDRGHSTVTRTLTNRTRLTRLESYICFVFGENLRQFNFSRRILWKSCKLLRAKTYQVIFILPGANNICRRHQQISFPKNVHLQREKAFFWNCTTLRPLYHGVNRFSGQVAAFSNADLYAKNLLPSVAGRRSESQHRRYLQWFGHAQQAVSDSGNSHHQAGCLHA